MTNLPIQLTRAAILLVVLFCAMNALTAHAQTSDVVADLAARVNRERVTRGLAPLALNAKLAAAAQTHAEDVARNGRTNSAQEGHIGSDGSTVFDRVARTGYGAYNWGRRLGENWAWYHSAADAMAMWMDSAPHRANILHPLFREMGIGVASNPAGGFVYVVDFGAQPNVLPLFINDEASETKSLDVKITLTSEQVAPNGDGDNIGQPVQVMISNAPDFAGAQWQPFAPTINWTLAPNGGAKTVYVKYRDAKGRTAMASDSIVIGAATTPTITPTRATPTRTPARATPRSTMIAALAPTEMLTLAATDIAPTETPTATMIATASASATATATSMPTSVSSVTSGETNLNGVGVSVMVVMSIVLIRVWYMANH
jgi:uncharacterized protein YkwD